MNRRDFFRTAAGGALASLLPAPLLHGRQRARLDPLLERLADAADDYSPFDSDLFEAAERVVFLSPSEASLNIIPKAGKSLDLRLVRANDGLSIQAGRSSGAAGVNESLDIPLLGYSWAPELVYRLEYRESGKGGWKSTPERRVKTPYSYSQTQTLEFIIISDDHTYDDADMAERIVYNQSLREARLSGDYVNMFLAELQNDPAFIPDLTADSGKLMSGYCLASAIRQILKQERPDFILLLGDSTGIGAGYKWKGLGLKDPNSGLQAQDLDDISKVFWLRMRKMYSALTPHVPVYLVQGNHDGEASYDAARVPAKRYRQKYFKQPGLRHGGAIGENYFPLFWGGDFFNGGAPLFLILDNESHNQPDILPKRPEDWSLGAQQKAWLKDLLTYDAEWKFAFLHHVLGGWPRGTNEDLRDYAYGRGPLFNYEDYRDYCGNPDLVEQVEVTRDMMARGLNAVFYGHDHIFHARRIPGPSGQKMYGICSGSPKHKGELDWYKGPLWTKHYGSYGSYGTEERDAFPKTTFWGPSGYTKIKLAAGSARVEYKRAAFNHPFTNIPPALEPGDLISSLIL